MLPVVGVWPMLCKVVSPCANSAEIGPNSRIIPRSSLILILIKNSSAFSCLDRPTILVV